MTIRIVCFEDDVKYRDLLKTIFSAYDAQFRFYLDPERDWNVTDAMAKEIEAFAPDFIVVDLRNDHTDDRLAGFRIIRQLRDKVETSLLPIIAWSALLGETPDGIRAAERAQNLGASPLYKSRHTNPSAQRFFDVIGGASGQSYRDRTAGSSS